jgi:iron(III) transport system ATP-binding protein
VAYVNLQGVTKRFGRVVAVDGLTIGIERGECFSMLGPSGCGKTTTLRMLAGFEDLDAGEITVGDRVVSSSVTRQYVPPEHRNFGMVFQAFAVWPHLTVLENVAFPLRIRGLPRADVAARARAAMEHTGLARHERAYPGALSGGEKQRIALARAIAIEPAVMLLDEPLSNLDPKLREEMRFEIKDLQRKLGLTIVFVTHDQAEAMALSDRILVMRDGVAQQVDTPVDVYTRPANRFVFSFIGLSNFVPVVAVDSGVRVEGAEGAGSVGHAPPPALGRRLLLACRPSDVALVGEGGVRGVIRRKAYLGDVVDYRVAVGPVEVRVQKRRRAAQGEVGEACGLAFERVRWYPHDDAA